MNQFRTSLFALSVACAVPAFAGNEGPGVAPIDPCGAPIRLDYVKLVTEAAIQGCGEYVADFTTTSGHGSITRFGIPQNPNPYYSVLVQDPATGKSISGVVKCDASTGTASLVALDFAATTSYGGCGF
jgi:hypothetical protein